MHSLYQKSGGKLEVLFIDEEHGNEAVSFYQKLNLLRMKGMV
ncbi:hypothetical protein [Clostridium estertheticum]|nr:hypothetical protein [Clostridium estertheticum]